MKRTLFTLLLALQVGVAGAAWYDEDGYAGDTTSGFSGDDAFFDFDESPGVDPLFSTPTSGTSVGAPAGGGKQRAFVPNDMYLEYFGNMSLSSQSAHLHMFNAYLSLPVTTSENTQWHGWQFDSRVSLRATWLENSGQKVLDENRLYTVGFQASVGHSIGRNFYGQIGVVPEISSDFDVMSHENFFLGCYGAVSMRASDNLRFTLGVAYMPDYYEHDFFPLIGLAWRFNPAWEARVEASRFSVVSVAHDKFQWGPFFQWNSAMWTVHRHRETQQFRMTNCILGVGCTYDIQTASGTKVQLLGDLGCSFYNTFRVRDKHGNETREKYRAHPGVYMRAGMQITF